MTRPNFNTPSHALPKDRSDRTGILMIERDIARRHEVAVHDLCVA